MRSSRALADADGVVRGQAAWSLAGLDLADDAARDARKRPSRAPIGRNPILLHALRSVRRWTGSENRYRGPRADASSPQRSDFCAIGFLDTPSDAVSILPNSEFPDA